MQFRTGDIVVFNTGKIIVRKQSHDTKGHWTWIDGMDVYDWQAMDDADIEYLFQTDTSAKLVTNIIDTIKEI